jgi:hypothetical protein
MTAALENLLAQLKQLSLEELLTLQERVTGEMRRKTRPESEPLTEAENDTRPLSQRLKMLKVDGWPADATYRREDI